MINDFNTRYILEKFIHNSDNRILLLCEGAYNMSEERTKWELIVELVNELKVDATKTYVKGNKSAGLRLRKGLMQLRELAKDCRAETLTIEK